MELGYTALKAWIKRLWPLRPRAGSWSPSEPLKRGGGSWARPEGTITNSLPQQVSKSPLKAPFPASQIPCVYGGVTLGADGLWKELRRAQHEAFGDH